MRTFIEEKRNMETEMPFDLMEAPDDLLEEDNDFSERDPYSEEEQADASDNISMDPFALYMREVNSYPLLTAEEEVELAKRVAQGDKEAEKTFVSCNLRLVVHIAGKLRGSKAPMLDMIQAGNIGLLTAVRKFDHTLGYRFSTYATWWIKQAITRYIADCEKTIRVPVHKIETINKVRKTASALTMKLGRKPTCSEIADALGMTVRKVEEILTTGQDVVSLNITVGEDGESSLEDFVADPKGETPEEISLGNLRREALMKAVDTLNEREQYVILSRYGFMGTPRTLEEIGNDLGVTRERIRQIEAKALRKLKSPRTIREYELYAI